MKRSSVLVSLLLTTLLMTGAGPLAVSQAAGLSATGSLSFQVDRLSGADRYATAAAVSRRFYSPGVPVVWVATGQDYPDGLAAGPAAARQGGPVLYVTRTSVPSATRTELQRLRPTRIMAVGGTLAISDTVLGQLDDLATSGATRVAGANRYATAAAVVRTAFSSTPVVWIATGRAFPDALAGGAAAAIQGDAVLLTDRDTLPTETKTELARLRPGKIVVVGGTAAVSSTVETALRAYSPSVVRRAGADRYATAVAVSSHVMAAGAADAVFLVTGLAFPDALGVIPAARLRNAPVLLVPSTSIPEGVRTELTRLGPDRAWLVGGEQAVGILVAKTIQRMFGVCWAPNKPPAGSAELLTVIPGTPNMVALTFDLGGRTTPALDIVEFLVDNQVCATIFPTGTTIQTPEGAAVLRALREHPELFEVGNHTMHHCHLVRGGDGPNCPASPPSTTFIRQEMQTADTVVKAAFGQPTVPYWRPPFGEQNATVRSIVAGAGWTKTVMWHLDTIDWDPETSASEIITRVVPRATAGSIVLLHLGGYATLDALPSLVSQLRARGWTLTTLSDMLD